MSFSSNSVFTEHRLVRENRALDWRPTEQTRTAPLAAALATDDDIKSDPALKAILDKITVLEHFIRDGCKGPLTPAMKKAALGPRGGLNGYRAGSAKDDRPPVGFDKAEMRALPFCKWCAHNGDGEKYHPWRDCPHGGAQPKHTGTAAAFCCPLDGEDLQAMALAQVFQDAADCGPDAFAAAIEVHGAPAVLLTAGGAAAELDMSAYGFSVPAEGRADYGALATRLDDLVSATSVSFDGGGTYGIATIAPAPPVERTLWPRTIECAASHEIATVQAQLDAGFAVSAGAFTASQISVPSAAGQHVAQTARRPTVGCGVPPSGFGMPAIGAVAVLSLLCISFAGVAVSASTATAASASSSATEMPSPGGALDWEMPPRTRLVLDGAYPAPDFFVATNVPPLEPPEPPDIFQDLAERDLGFDIAYHYRLNLQSCWAPPPRVWL
ncbi:hypothetical protein CYMTET_24402 [Cymbomonas tetramitiformis]|uniref:Uncharacterized protein n=1 Tax=Cymbomonas tetramitiformis TaxID=36881 RepID=A0AAE0FXC0_9CHLO|nr:hypothetical protein CYMTET_24402 [Cymbomonas tetramitiformis]